jgi:hypothetical protein
MAFTVPPTHKTLSTLPMMRILPSHRSVGSQCVSLDLHPIHFALRATDQQDKALCKNTYTSIYSPLILISISKAPDALKMAPFQVGDYLEYSGINIGGMIVCYTIVAPNVQITTSGAPTFIRVEDAIVGIYDGSAGSEFGDSRVSY